MLRYKFIILFIFSCTIGAYSQPSTPAPGEEKAATPTKVAIDTLKWEKTIEKIQKDIWRIKSRIASQGRKISSQEKMLKKAVVDAGDLKEDLKEIGKTIKDMKNIGNRITEIESRIAAQEEQAKITGDYEKWIFWGVIGISLISISILLIVIALRVTQVGAGKKLPLGQTDELLNRMHKIDNNIRLLSKTTVEKRVSPPSKGTRDLHRRVYELKDSGLSSEEIAKRLGIGKGEVEFILKLGEKGYKEEL